MDTASKGYNSKRLGFCSRFNEMRALIAGYRRNPEERVRNAIAEMLVAIAEIEAVLGKPFQDLDILEIGSGQHSLELAILSNGNRAIGIDQENCDDRVNVKNVLRTIKSDGFIRAAKTVVRKSMGFDTAKRNEFLRQRGIASFPKLNIMQMDAESMSFPSNSFDVIFSGAVFEHIANPEQALRESARVLRPGGVFNCGFHLYTSDSGCHDARIFANQRGDLPYWAHLRDSHRHKVIENTYLNRLRLEEWRRIIEATMPGAKVDALNDGATDAKLLSELAKIRENGELTDYSDEELLSYGVKVLWKR